MSRTKLGLAAASIALVLGFSTSAFAADPPQAKTMLKGFKSTRGMFTIHRKGHTAYLEVPSSMMRRPFLLATAFSAGSFNGWTWSEMVCAFERVDNQLVLMEKEVRYRSQNRGRPMASVVQRTYTDRMIHPARIVALNGANPLISLNSLFGANAAKFFGGIASALDGRVVMIGRAKTYPMNVELTLTVPDRRQDGRLVALSYSLSSLQRPEMQGFRPRKADDRVGYFMTAVKDYTDTSADQDQFVRFIHRWNLQKEDRSLTRSPVRNPIIFYIEKTVPFRFRQAVREGILEWNKAFEKLGLLSAVVVRQQPRQGLFADYEPEDVRYNFFRWTTSGRAMAMGPSRVNPWTGQILDADIIFDEAMVQANLRSYDLQIREDPKGLFAPGLRQLFQPPTTRSARFLRGLTEEPAKKALDPFSFMPERHRGCTLGRGVERQLALSQLVAGQFGDVAAKGAFPSEFLNEVVKDVVMHEVGHTLGLRHNFKASMWRSLDDINKDAKKDTKVADLCASVMDYNPINIPVAKEKRGNFTMRTLGPYDYWAVQFGYDPNDGKARSTIARVASQQFTYATDEDTYGPDPYAQRWDLGSDPIRFSKERMDLVNTLLPKVLERSVKKGDSYETSRRAVDMLLSTQLNASMAVTRFVGGQHTSRHHKGDAGAKPPVVPVAAKKQREALDLLCARVFSKGNFSLPPALLRMLAKGHWRHWGLRNQPHSYPYHDRVLTIQSWVLWGLMNPGTLERLVDTSAKVDANEDVVTVPEVLSRLSQSIFGTLLAPKTLTGRGTARQPLVPTIQRNLQRHYVGQLIGMTREGEAGWTPPTVRTVVRLEAKTIRDGLKAVLELEAEAPDRLRLDAYSRGHIEEMINRIDKALSASYRIQ